MHETPLLAIGSEGLGGGYAIASEGGGRDFDAVGMGCRPAIGGRCEGIRHVAAVYGYMGNAVPIKFGIRPRPQKARGLPVGNARAVGVDEYDIVCRGYGANGEQQGEGTKHG